MMRSKKNLPACRSNPENGTQGISIAARHLHEECGVFGVYAKTRCDVAGLCYYALYALQHRGQESCGHRGERRRRVPHDYRDVGLVSQVFSPSVCAGRWARATWPWATCATAPPADNGSENVPAHRGEPPSRAAWHWPTTAIWYQLPWSLRAGAGNAEAPSSTPPATRRSSPTSSCRSA
jgi:hypothetical protein